MTGTRDAARVGVVVATRDRRDSLARTLAQLDQLDPRPPVVVVDNGSGDGSPDLVADRFPHVRLVTLPANAGAVARNTGVRLLDTAHVAFADDDSWWAPGALSRAGELLDASPRLGVVVARIVLDPGGDTDPVSQKMARAPIGRAPDLPGPSVAGFPACGAVVRRAAFAQAGGFSALLGFGGEEELLSLDLARLGWGQSYCAEVVAVHAPDATGPRGGAPGRWARQQRNSALTAAARLGGRQAVRAGGALVRAGLGDPAAARGAAGLAGRLPGALAGRRWTPPRVRRDHRVAGRPLR